MKNQQTIVDNKNIQLLRPQSAPKIVIAHNLAADGGVASPRQHTALWCSPDRQSSILVQTLTKLSLISLFIVDNFARRYDSCSALCDDTAFLSH